RLLGHLRAAARPHDGARLGPPESSAPRAADRRLGARPVPRDRAAAQPRLAARSTLALVLGLAAALWAGMGVFLASQNAMNHLWGVPFKRRPDPLHARGRALLLLALLGGGALAATILAALATVGARYGVTWKIGSLALSTALNIGLFWLGFRLLTAREVTWRQLRGGAIAAGALYELLQTLGGYYVGHTLKHASNVYGTFGLVIGLLSWVYLTSHITLLAAEANVVA